MTDAGDNKQIIVSVDADLEDLIPGFLENRQTDIDNIKEALRNKDYETIRVLGHSMKGAGGGYGFDEISEIGARLEQAALTEDGAVIIRIIEQLREYLEQVVVVFEE